MAIGLDSIEITEGDFVWQNSLEKLSGMWTNWYDGEPNNGFMGNEDCVQITYFHVLFQIRRGFRWKWSDLGCNSKLGFICEFK